MQDLKNKILSEAKKKGLNEAELIIKIGMTRTGFDKMFSNDSVKLKTLQNIAKVLELPLSYFLEDADNQANESQTTYGNKYVDELIKSKDETIAALRDALSAYKNGSNNSQMKMSTI